MIDFLFNPPLAHLMLRVVLGALFMAHGYPKLFKNFSGTAGWFDSIGLRPGKFWVLVVGSVEFFGGLALILGIWVEIVGLLLAIQMFVAMWKVKWGNASFTGEGGWELDLIYLATALAIAMMGPGVYTLF